MKMNRAWGPVLGAVLCAGAALPVAPASAATAPAYVTTVNSIYFPGDVTMLQGSTLTLVNMETIAHDLVSSDVENGLPLFKARITAGQGDKAEVVGASALGVGLWPYYCSLHEAMRGVIDVRALP